MYLNNKEFCDMESVNNLWEEGIIAYEFLTNYTNIFLYASPLITQTKQTIKIFRIKSK